MFLEKSEPKATNSFIRRLNSEFVYVYVSCITSTPLRINFFLISFRSSISCRTSYTGNLNSRRTGIEFCIKEGKQSSEAEPSHLGNNVLIIPFVKSPLAVNPAMSSLDKLYLQGRWPIHAISVYNYASHKISYENLF